MSKKPRRSQGYFLVASCTSILLFPAYAASSEAIGRLDVQPGSSAKIWAELEVTVPIVGTGRDEDTTEVGVDGWADVRVAPAVAPFDEMTTTEWRMVFGVNMEGAFWTFREAIRHMKPRGSGSLVVTSSLASELGFPRGEHYAATKSGVRSLIEGLAVEYGKHGIRANAIAPGWVVTGMTDAFIEEDRFETTVKPRIPLGRWGRPEDFAGVAVYLASDASSWHTGDTITIDGGFLKR